MRQIGSFIAATACALLLAAPAIAQPSGGAPAAAPAAKAAAKSKHKFSCYDYAWQSKEMQDCLAKASAKPAAAKKPMKMKMAPAKKSS
ncbi:MAG TPA: hypothetical protein VKV32_01120 [Stellaceae bacterium]|nr:hypothetical protein [Stellaceae bacterium]